MQFEMLGYQESIAFDILFTLSRAASFQRVHKSALFNCTMYSSTSAAKPVRSYEEGTHIPGGLKQKDFHKRMS
jgi:hypothetical protein